MGKMESHKAVFRPAFQVFDLQSYFSETGFFFLPTVKNIDKFTGPLALPHTGSGAVKRRDATIALVIRTSIQTSHLTHSKCL